jgi:fibronectin-binding autotransporter adhesin
VLNPTQPISRISKKNRCLQRQAIDQKTRMKPKKNPFLAVITLAGFALAAPSAQAATLTWDTANDGATITAGNGAWNTTGGNLVWNNAGTNVIWSQTSATVATNAAVFAGTDGTANQYAIAIAGSDTMNAQSLTFNSSGYQISGGTLALRPTGTTNGSITVAAGKTATIDSLLSYSNNAAAANTINSGATLNLGGGASNSQYTFNGAGTVNITGGSYEANIGNINVSSFNISGGTYNITPGNTGGYNFGNAVARNVDVRVTDTGALTLNNTATNTGATAPYIAIGNNTNNTAYTTSLTVQSGGTVSVGALTNRAGELRISNTANANGLLDVQGGTVTIGTGKAANQIYLFKAGSGAGYTAAMTQSGGTVTTNGIQFGGTTGTYDAASSASLQVTGGSLYIGAAGITKGSGAGALTTTIKLEGGTVGADASWSSSLDMQLGTAGGGVTFSSQSAAGGGRAITLSGNLSDVSGVNGTLTKAGVSDMFLTGTNNTYSGGTTVDAGRLFINAAGALPSTGAVTVNAGILILNASGTPAYTQSITLADGSNLSLRKAATLSNVTLATAGTLTFNKDDAATQALTLSSATALTGALTVQVGGGTGAAGAVTLTGILSGSGGSLVKTGSGTLSLTGANTFDGGLTIENGTVEAKVSPAALGAGTVAMGGAGSTGATLITGKALSNAFTINAPDSGSVIIGANGGGSGFTLSGGITLNGGLTIQTYNNVISGATKATAGITGGITGTGDVVLDNLGLAANAFNITTNAINHTGSLTLQGTATGDTTIGAAIGANVTGVTQNSATSRLVLSGVSTYTGATNVNAGVLAVNGSLANTSTTVGSGGTLQGSGSIAGAVTVQSGGIIAAGNSIESLATGALTLGGGSTFAYEIDKDAAAGVAGDLTAVTGNLTLDVSNLAILTLTELGTAGSWTAGDKLTLISYSGTWNGGLFDYGGTLADDSTINFSGMDWTFNYNDTAAGTNYTGDLTGSSYVTMTAIPEPNVAALLGGLSVLALLRRRRN